MADCKTVNCRNKSRSQTGFCPKCTNKSKPKTNAAYVCPDCDDEVIEGQRAMCCDFCSSWHHIACIGMDKETYDVLFKDSNEVKGIQWYCQKCQKKAKEAIDKYITLEKETKRLKEDMAQVKDDIAGIKKAVSQTVKDEISVNMNERQEIEARKMNLVIFS